jgi:hypothetical protein
MMHRTCIMATRAELFRSEEQKHGTPKKSRARKPRKHAWSRTSAHAAGKATHAFEATAPGARPSRESSRGGANRAKADAAYNLTEESKKGAPSNRAREARAKGTKVRGNASRP